MPVLRHGQAVPQAMGLRGMLRGRMHPVNWPSVRRQGVQRPRLWGAGEGGWVGEIPACLWMVFEDCGCEGHGGCEGGVEGGRGV
jgi:hypothetical protein